MQPTPEGGDMNRNDTLQLDSRPDTLGTDAKQARGLEQLARWMDSVFEIPFLKLRFGLDAILGLLPGGGDVGAALVSVYILSAANRHGVPRATILRMALNIALDFMVGSIPIAGDLFDVYWKSNQRNVELLRRHMAATPQAEFKLQKSDRLFVWILVGIICVLTLASVVVAYFAVTWLAGALKSLTG
jgi:hypothetical protein